MTLKQFLTTESFHFSGFTISSLFVTYVLIFIIYIIFLKLKKREIPCIRLGFLTLATISFLFAFINGLTGEFLFGQKDGMTVTIYMFIAVFTMGLYIIDEFKKIPKIRE